MANVPLPSQREPVIDVKTGRMTPNWYRYFEQINALINAGL